MFGLAFITTFSCLATALDIFLLRFLIYLSRFRKALAPKLDQWVQDGIFQLQRRAYEAQGEGTWSRFDQEIPVTEKGDQLSVHLVEATLPTTELTVQVGKIEAVQETERTASDAASAEDRIVESSGSPIRKGGETDLAGEKRSNPEEVRHPVST